MLQISKRNEYKSAEMGTIVIHISVGDSVQTLYYISTKSSTLISDRREYHFRGTNSSPTTPI
jgi:hypothetical protein